MGILDAPIQDASSSAKGKVQLAGDLGGTAASPTVPTKITGPSSATPNAIVRYSGSSGKLAKDSGPTITDNGSITMPVGQQLLLSANTPTGSISKLIRFDLNTTYDRPWLAWYDENTRLRAVTGYHTTDYSSGNIHAAYEIKTSANPAGSTPLDMRTRFSVGTDSDRITTGFNYTDVLEVNQGENAPNTQFGLHLRAVPADTSTVGSADIAVFTAQLDASDNAFGFLDIKPPYVIGNKQATLNIFRNTTSSSGSSPAIAIKKGDGSNTNSFVLNAKTGNMTATGSVSAVGFDAGSAKITNLATPTVSTDAVTKAYVDTAISTLDDVLEYTNIAAFPVTGTTNTIYLADDTNYLYRWSGSSYVQVGGTSSTGTVTSASVITANGLAGTVATATTTPAITLSTTVTGLLKGNGTAISAATAGTDYLTPTGSGAGLTSIPESAVTNLTTDLAAKEPSIAAGTTSQFYRGDKTFQTLNVASLSDSTTIALLAASQTFSGTNTYSGILTFDGTAARTIGGTSTLMRATTGAGNTLTVQAGGAQSGATDTAGGDLILTSGISTGTTRSNIKFNLPVQAASTATADNAPATRAIMFAASANGPVFSLGTSTSPTGLVTTSNAFAVTGNFAGGIGAYRHTTTNTAGTSFTVNAGGATSGATDKAGGTLALTSGVSTGTGTGSVTISTPTPAASTGTADNTNTVRVTVDSSQMNVQHGFRTKRTAVADAAYTILVTDHIVAYTSLTAARAVTLPSASTAGAGAEFIVKDESGSAGTFNITVTGTIDGAANKLINAAYGVVRVYSNGTNWFTW